MPRLARDLAPFLAKLFSLELTGHYLECFSQLRMIEALYTLVFNYNLDLSFQ